MGYTDRMHFNLEYLRKILKHYTALSRPICREFGIQGTAFDIIMFLYNNPEYHTARDIVSVRGIKPSLVSVNIDSLVASGYLLREHDPDDRRTYILTLTKKSEEITAKGRAMQQRFSESMLKGIDRETLLAVDRFFSTVEENIKGMGE